jgi:hypothetical protein
MRAVRGSAWFAVFATLAAPAGAATPQILADEATAPVGTPVVRTAANGDLTVLWSDGRHVRASFRLNGGRFFVGHVVPGLPSLDSRFAGVRSLMTTSGDAVAVWPAPGDRSRSLVAHAPRGGPFGAPQAAPAPVGFGTLAFSPDGHGAVLSGPRPGLSVALGEPDGRWGGPQRLATESVIFPRVAVGDDGGVVVAWNARGACGPAPAHTVAGFCQFLRVAMRPPGGVFAPTITLEASGAYVGPPQVLVDAAGRPVVIWRHVLADANATVLARGTFTGGFAPPATLPGTDRPTADACPPPNGLGYAPDPRVVAVRARPDGGAFVLIDRDEGCGPLLSEVPLAPDGTAEAPVRLTAAPLAPKLGIDFLGFGGRTPALVTRTAAGAVAVARTAPEAPFAAPIAVALPVRARRGPTAVLRGGRVVVAFSRPCRPGSHVSEAVVVAPGGTASKPVRLSRCGDPSPVQVDRTGRAVFVARRGGDLVAWASAPIG